jgi:hypothetical protein
MGDDMKCASKSLACVWAKIVDQDGTICTERGVLIRCPAADDGAIYDIADDGGNSGSSHPAYNGKEIEIGMPLGANS